MLATVACNGKCSPLAAQDEEGGFDFSSVSLEEANNGLFRSFLIGSTPSTESSPLSLFFHPLHHHLMFDQRAVDSGATAVASGLQDEKRKKCLMRDASAHSPQAQHPSRFTDLLSGVLLLELSDAICASGPNVSHCRDWAFV